MPFPPSPFRLFETFPGVDVAMLRKEDLIDSDDRAAEVLGVDDVAAVEQTHGAGVAVVRDAIRRSEQADGLITDVPGLTLTVRWGDCQNFVIYAPDERVIGLLHAGWRGLAAGIIPAYYQTLRERFGIEPEETYVGAGPSLCTSCSDFTDPAKELPAAWTAFFHGKCADLRGIADIQLADLGVPSSHIERHPDCTRCHPDLYWTWRGGHKDEMEKKCRNVLACRLA